MQYEVLTDLQWQVIEPLFPHPVKRGRGKPHTAWRKVLNSILFVLCTGAKWESLPKEEHFASKSASHRWFKIWEKSGLLREVLVKLQELSVLAGDIKFPSTRERSPKVMMEQSSSF